MSILSNFKDHISEIGLFIFAALLLSTTMSSCLLEPGEGKIIDNSNEEISFSGYWSIPNDKIILKAKNPCSEEWEDIGETLTRSQASTYLDNFPRDRDEKFYYWSASKRIPDKYWKKEGNSLYRAVVKASLESGTDLVSFEMDYFDCLAGKKIPTEFMKECQSRNSPEVNIFAHNHTDLFKGSDCNYANPDGNNCVNDLIGQLTGIERLNISHPDLDFGIPHPGNFGFGNHVQGVGRLSDWDGLGRMVITDNGTESGFRLAFQDIENADEALFSSNRVLRDPVTFDIRNEQAYGNHDHPGGLQVEGDIVAIAMEGGPAEFAAVYFLKIEGDQINYISTLHLDGSRGEPHQKEQNSAASVGLLRMQNGTYLLAVSGSNHGTQGIWFYESATADIQSTTHWNYITFFSPTCVGFGNEDDGCYAGAGGGLNLLSDCSGQIYMLAMHGTNGRGVFKQEHQYLQVFRLQKEVGQITLEKITQQRDNVGLTALRTRSFRWAGGIYISRSGQLAIMNTERRRISGSNDRVNGYVYLGK